MLLTLDPHAKLSKSASPSSLFFPKLLSVIYNQPHVLENVPISEEIRREVSHKMLVSNHNFNEKSSEKTKSYMNLFSQSPQIKKSLRKNQANRGLIAKLFRNPHNNKLYLQKYDAVLAETREFPLESYFPLRKPSKKLAFARNSGFVFIYDDQGVVSVFSQFLKVMELSLNDQRVGPTLFVHEIDAESLILFVVGGVFPGSGDKTSRTCDNIAVFYLDSGHVLENQPLFFVKMKYPRMFPVVLLHKLDKDKKLLVFGGNSSKKKVKGQSPRVSTWKKPAFALTDANFLCESVSIRRIRQKIRERLNNQENAPFLMSTEDSLCVIFNSFEENAGENARKFADFFENAATLRCKDRKKHQVHYLFGLGKQKNQIWCLERLDFVEHKAFVFQCQGNLKKNRDREICNAMFCKIGEEIFYLDDENTTQYRKIAVNKIKKQAENSNCIVF